MSGGLPFRVLEAARSAKDGEARPGRAGLADAAVGVLRRVALLGSAFTTDELLAVSGVGEDETYAALAAGLETSVVEPAETGYRFRHALVRDAVLATFAPHERSRAGGEVAELLAELGRRRPGWPTCSSPRGIRCRRSRTPVRAVETAGALGAYRDGLAAHRRRARPRVRRRPRPPARPARRPAARARRPGRGGGVPRRPLA